MQVQKNIAYLCVVSLRDGKRLEIDCRLGIIHYNINNNISCNYLWGRFFINITITMYFKYYFVRRARKNRRRRLVRATCMPGCPKG